MLKTELIIPANSAVDLGLGASVGDAAVQVRLWGKDGVLLARETDWPQPLKYCVFTNRGLVLEFNRGQEKVRASAKRPVKGLVYETEGVGWSDNCLDVMPGDPQVVKTEGLGGKTLGLRWYGSRGKEDGMEWKKTTSGAVDRYELCAV